MRVEPQARGAPAFVAQRAQERPLGDQLGRRVELGHAIGRNAVDAHLQAWLELQGEGRCDGRAYFISDGQPIAMKTMINRMLQAAGLDPVNRHVPLSLARMLAPLVETAWRSLRLRGEPMLTRFVVDQFATAHWYDIGAAQRDFGYAPKVDLEQGMRRLQDSLAAAAPTS